MHFWQGVGYGSVDGTAHFLPDTQFPPLYPIIIAFFALYIPQGFVILAVLQACIAALSTVLVYRLGKKVVADRTAFIVAFLFAFEPLIALTHMLMMPETFFVFCILMSVYALVQGGPAYSVRSIIISALSLAAATYIKPVAMYIVIVFEIMFLAYRARRAAAVYAFIFLLLLLPWVVRNGIVADTYTFSSHGTNATCGYFIFSVFATEYHSDPSNMDMALFPNALRSTVAECRGMFSGIVTAASRYPVSFIKTIVLSTASFLSNEGYAVFFQDKLNAIKPHNNYLTPTVLVMHDWREKIVETATSLRVWELGLILAGKLMWVGIFICACFGAVYLVAKASTRHIAMYLILVACYFIFTAVVGIAYAAGARLRMPANPFILILAGAGIEYMRALYKGRIVSTTTKDKI